MMKTHKVAKFFDNNIPINFIDYTNNHLEKIHKQLFDNAVTQYCEDNDLNKNDYKIIDIKNEENYLLPSKAILFSKRELKRDKIDLTEYWNLNYLTLPQQNIFNDLLIDDENKKDIEIDYIDFVKGKVFFINKFTNKTFSIDFSKINNNLQYKKKLENTFTNLLRNAY